MKVGDRVVFLSAPDWLLKDLPAEEQGEIRSFVGQMAEITEIDQFGYFWIGFGSFAVTADCLKTVAIKSD